MEEQIISFETAKLAKEKGFNEITKYAYWRNIEDNYNLVDNSEMPNDELCSHNYSAPTQSLLQKWLWKEWTIFVEVYIHHLNESAAIFRVRIVDLRLTGTKTFFVPRNQFTSFEKTLEFGLLEALKLLEDVK